MSERLRCHQLAAVAVLTVAVFAARPVPALVDPTRPHGVDDRAAAPLRLQSVLVGEQRRVAVINGRSLTVGDRVAGAEVVRIERQQVWLRRGGETFSVRLSTPSLRKRTVRSR